MHKLFPLTFLLTVTVTLASAQIRETVGTAGDLIPKTYNNEPVFEIAEQSPEFPGGSKKLMKYIKSNLKYPKAARAAKIEGKVHVVFLVTKTGDITFVQVAKGIGYGADEEAIRIITSGPKWKPGKQSGRPINVAYSVPIHFKL